MMTERVHVEDNDKAVKYAYNDRSTNVVTQNLVDGGKSLSQQAENRPLGQQRSVLDVPDPRGSGVRNG